MLGAIRRGEGEVMIRKLLLSYWGIYPHEKKEDFKSCYYEKSQLTSIYKKSTYF
jgi:hypothetical protein